MQLTPMSFKPMPRAAARPAFQGQWDAEMKTYPARKAAGEKLAKLVGQQPLVLEILSDIQFFCKTEAEINTLSEKLAKVPGMTSASKQKGCFLYRNPDAGAKAEPLEVNVKRKDPRKC